MPKLKITNGVVVTCMNCHQQLGTLVDTEKQAEKLAKIHLQGGGDKDHTNHTMTFTKVKVVKLA